MKKLVIICISIILAALCVLGGAFIYSKLTRGKTGASTSSPDDPMPFWEVARSTSYETLKASADKHKLKTEEDFGNLYVYSANGWGVDFNISGAGNADGGYKRIEAYGFLKAKDDELDAEKLKESAKRIISGFIKMFGVTDLQGGYYICDSSGNPLGTDLSTSYEAVLRGDASIKTSVKENEDSYWELCIISSGSADPVCNIVHYIKDSDFASVSGIININN